MRWVRTRVLPEPAPARTSSGPSPWRDRLALRLVQPGEQALGAVRAGLGRGAQRGVWLAGGRLGLGLEHRSRE